LFCRDGYGRKQGIQKQRFLAFVQQTGGAPRVIRRPRRRYLELAVKVYNINRRAASFNFHVPGNYQALEEILTAKSKKSNKFLLASPFFSFFFAFFDFVVNFFLQSMLLLTEF
jgi:hypothetical protein